MKKRRDLSQDLLYDSYIAPIQTYDEKKTSELFKISYVRQEEKKLRKELHKARGFKGWLFRFSAYLWRILFGHFAEEWVFLAILGILVALISYMIDWGVRMCNWSRMWLYGPLAHNGHPWAKYFAWIALPVTLCMFSAGFVKLVGPKAVGSGIPEMKTLLRGVPIPDFLSFHTLIAKVVGITSTLGSTMPLGKEGPLMHISCCCAHLIGKITTFQGIYRNESRKLEMLAAATAVGVGCTFGAPIAGVLLSVEITTAYYGVRNYWRGFCAAVWGATFYRLLYVWIEGMESVTVVFKTSFFVDTPWAAQELLAFSILGIICGFGAAFYMRMRIKFGRFVKGSKLVARIKKANHFVYPGFISLVVASINFPPGIGQFMAGHLGYAVQVKHMFANFSWMAPNLTVAQQDIVNQWKTPWTGPYLHLVCLIAFNFVCNILSATMPIPNGSFAPVFRIGAAAGRILGELMNTWYPTGLSYYGRVTKIVPGGYALVGAAAFSGAVTQTMCVGVLVLEMTSQITHVIPILIANLISNSIAQLCGSGLYDSAIKAKKLPYLPDMLPRNNAIYSVYVEDFMITDVKYIYHGMPFEQLKNLLKDNKKIKSFPLVNNPVRLILLGSIQRLQLIELIERQVGKHRRLQELNEEEQNELQKPKSDQFKTQDVANSSESSDDNFTYNPAYEARPKSVKLPNKRVCDLSPKTQKRWERFQMQKPADFRLCHIDPAPFQLVERTSLLKVHSLFSLVGINTAYVTTIGRLIGVVSLKELRQAISDVKSGKLTGHNISIIVSEET
ncbi:chloride channel protein 2 [Tribolium castaneum]|nr:PREDICTED: chloride channel protein 2-like [Tribolium castaneum]|eukprot:XP_015836329.1 PREDICTED: chloride channel protein 2-like [Tribolium castaneum]